MGGGGGGGGEGGGEGEGRRGGGGGGRGRGGEGERGRRGRGEGERGRGGGGRGGEGERGRGGEGEKGRRGGGEGERGEEGEGKEEEEEEITGQSIPSSGVDLLLSRPEAFFLFLLFPVFDLPPGSLLRDLHHKTTQVFTQQAGCLHNKLGVYTTNILGTVLLTQRQSPVQERQ